MSMGLLEQVAVQEAGNREAEGQAWAVLVAAVVDETIAADDVVVRLRKLGRDAGQLQQASELLRQRREWASAVEAGKAAETTLADCVRETAEAEAKLAKLVEAHEAKLQPVLLRREAAVRALNMASTAERSLRESVPRAARDRLLSGIVAEERALSANRESLEKEIRDVFHVVDTTESYGESASSTDKARLPAAKQRLATLRQRMRESDEAAAVLASKRSTVERDLLKPEVW
jgi:hypothetical protein